jgi:hypothetical protein
MALKDEDFERLAAYIKAHLGEWLAEQNLGKPPPMVHEIEVDTELRERIIRMEEELKHQRELMRQGLEIIEQHLLEQVDKRFEQQIVRLDRFTSRTFWLAVSCTGLVIAVILW